MHFSRADLFQRVWNTPLRFAYAHTPNFGSYSFRTDRFTPQLQDHGPRNGCECVRQGQVFAALRGRGRYSSLSPEDW